MAETIKRRVAAARLAVAFVAAGTIAGASAWASASPPPKAQESILISSQKLKIDSGNIKNGSLLFQDFKAGEVLSTDTFVKFKKADTAFKKAESSFKYDVNGDLQTIKGEVDSIKGELPAYIKMNDADARYLKTDASVMHGDGSVLTATKAVAPNNSVPLLDVPNLVTVDALPGGTQLQLTNTSGADLSHSSCKDVAGKPDIGAGTLKPGESLSCATGEQTEPVQLIGGSGGSEVVTLNFTKIGPQVTVQILIGL